MTLELTIDQINIIMQALGNSPYVQVEALVNEIRKQVQPQLAPQEAPPRSIGSKIKLDLSNK
jgi:hypothetical protein